MDTLLPLREVSEKCVSCYTKYVVKSYLIQCCKLHFRYNVASKNTFVYAVHRCRLNKYVLFRIPDLFSALPL